MGVNTDTSARYFISGHIHFDIKHGGVICNNKIVLANVYEKYNAKLDEIGYATKEDIFSAVTNRIMSETFSALLTVHVSRLKSSLSIIFKPSVSF